MPSSPTERTRLDNHAVARIRPPLRGTLRASLDGPAAYSGPVPAPRPMLASLARRPYLRRSTGQRVARASGLQWTCPCSSTHACEPCSRTSLAADRLQSPSLDGPAGCSGPVPPSSTRCSRACSRTSLAADRLLSPSLDGPARTQSTGPASPTQRVRCIAFPASPASSRARRWCSVPVRRRRSLTVTLAAFLASLPRKAHLSSTPTHITEPAVPAWS
jgi:hypothetical protein